MRALIGLSLMTLAACGCGQPAPTPTAPASAPPRTLPAIFADVTSSAGLDFTYRNGEEAGHLAILESLGGGVGLIDYDGDGLLDVFLPGGGHFGPNKEILGYPNRLWRNEGACKFRDVTAAVGLKTTGELLYSHGCAVGDYDNDGWPDLLVTGYGRMILYHNDRGQFIDVTRHAGLFDARPLHWSTSAAWGDLDGDGWLDLFVAHYVDWSFQNHPRCGVTRPGEPPDVCHPSAFKAVPHAVFRNNGDGAFTDLSAKVGLKPGKGLGVVLADVNDDNRLDVYVANDTTDNLLYLNQGDWRFTEVAQEKGVAVGERGRPDGSMGVTVSDVDGSGRLSFFVTNFEGEAHALYQQLANRRFAHASVRTGLTAIGLRFVGFGTSFLDYDNDGVEDLLFVNGHAAQHPAPPTTRKQRPVLFRNLRRPGVRGDELRFVDVSDQGGTFFKNEYLGRGLAVGDLDNDGRVDAIVSNVNDPAVVLRNVLANDAHWLGIRLVGRPNPDAIGARVTLEVGGVTLTRWVVGGGSYLSANDRRIVFGLGQTTRAGTLTVHWPGGTTERWQDLAIDQYHLIRQGQSTP